MQVKLNTNISRLRSEVVKYKDLGLPIEKRKVIQKTIGYSESSAIMQDVVELSKSKLFNSIMLPITVENFENTSYIAMSTFLGRNNLFFRVASEMNLTCLKKSL